MPRKSLKSSRAQGFRGKALPLKGIIVIDASRVLAGPFCGQLLADLGATVIKIEQPGAGDETRGWGPPFVGDQSAYYLSCNRNKRAITLDIATKAGQAILAKLLKKADVLLENFRAESLARLGLSTTQLRRRYPGLVICSISGFGRNSSWSQAAGYDFAVQAQSGLMSITGATDGEPMKAGVAIVDVLTGLYAATAVLAHLKIPRSRARGVHVDMALMDCAVAAQVNVAQAFLATRRQPRRVGNAHLQIVPYQLFKTKDSWLVLAIGNDRQWLSFLSISGDRGALAASDYATNVKRVKAREELVPKVAALLARRSTATWIKQLGQARVPCAPVWNYHDVFASPLASERAWVEPGLTGGDSVDLLSHPFHFDCVKRKASRPPPRLGEHTREVLKSMAGLSAKQIRELAASGVI